MSKLKPCPLCGGSVELENYGFFESVIGKSCTTTIWEIRCVNCGLKLTSKSQYILHKDGTVTDRCNGRSKIIRLWNTIALLKIMLNYYLK